MLVERALLIHRKTYAEVSAFALLNTPVFTNLNIAAVI